MCITLIVVVVVVVAVVIVVLVVVVCAAFWLFNIRHHSPRLKYEEIFASGSRAFRSLSPRYLRKV